MISLISASDFPHCRRDPLLDYEDYCDEAEDYLARIPRATRKLGDPAWLQGRDATALWQLSGARAEYALDLLTLSYSAGAPIASLRDFFPLLLSYFEEYALYTEALNKSPEGRGHLSPAIAIRDVEFERANRLLSSAILLRWAPLIPRVMDVINYGNSARDAMLERLAGVYSEEAQPLPAECARSLPYFKTLAMFSAPARARAELMRKYLKEWYDASHREPYYNSHALGNHFLGYWPWEAAAITVALDIDDASYRTLPYYPRDMVAFARSAKHAQLGA